MNVDHACARSTSAPGRASPTVEIAERFPDAVSGGWGDGETSEQVAERVLLALTRISSRHAHGPVLVVSHGGPLRAILQHLSVEHGRIGNCEVFRVDY